MKHILCGLLAITMCCTSLAAAQLPKLRKPFRLPSPAPAEQAKESKAEPAKPEQTVWPVPQERLPNIQQRANAARNARFVYNAVKALTVDSNSPCFAQVLKLTEMDASARETEYNYAILVERLLLQVPNAAQWNETAWAFEASVKK